MRPKAGPVIALTVSLWIATFASVSAATVTFNYAGGNVFISATEIISQGETKLILKGNPCLKDTNTAAKTVLEASAETITLTFFTGKSPKAGAMALIKSAEFVGPVRICQTSQKAMVDEKTGEQSTVTATVDVRSDDARYDGATHMVCLDGNVKITMIDPSSPFEGPVVVTGEAAAINLDPNPGPDDFRYKVSKARLEATPKAKED